MPINRLLSNLRKEHSVLSEASKSNLEYFTKNGYRKGVSVDFKKTEKIQDSIKLLAQLAIAEQEIADSVDLIPQAFIDKEFGLT